MGHLTISNKILEKYFGFLINIDNNSIMVTENVKEFDRIHGIKIENWIKR